TVLGDKDKLKQVFINLLSNGIKFSSSDSTIDIMVFSEEKEIVVQVKDNGIGIAKEDIPFIFERLYRGDKSRQEIEGSGIGLSIVKSILEHHFARIEVESEMDKGTTFTIHIPKTSA
ncbi:MAG: sensor histidine kinase, partial [Clostridiaceae bacterium]